MKSKIKILHVITHLPIGGAQDNTLYTVELLDKEKYDISLCCNLDGTLVERAKKIEDIKLFDIPFLCREVSPYKDIRAFLSLYKLFKEEDFTIIHTHSSKAGLLARLAAVLNKTPIVIHTIHGFAFNDFMNIFKKNFFIYLEKLLLNLDEAKDEIWVAIGPEGGWTDNELDVAKKKNCICFKLI